MDWLRCSCKCLMMDCRSALWHDSALEETQPIIKPTSFNRRIQCQHPWQLSSIQILCLCFLCAVSSFGNAVWTYLPPFVLCCPVVCSIGRILHIEVFPTAIRELSSKFRVYWARQPWCQLPKIWRRCLGYNLQLKRSLKLAELGWSNFKNCGIGGK